jgi:Fe-S cluster biogenesis protein NfuA
VEVRPLAKFTVMNLIAVQEALEPVVRMLAVEDYHISVSGGDDAVQLEISAGEGACSYCLVSKSTLRSIALDHMTKAGLPNNLEVAIVYPNDSTGPS